MRKTFIATTAAILVAANALAGMPAATKPALPAAPALPAPAARLAQRVAPGDPPPGAPGNNTAYERAITAYLDNVVHKARQKLPPAPEIAPSSPAASAPGYPDQADMGGGSRRPSLPRVERITIGIAARAVLETPDGGRLRVSPGAETPYGEVTAIRAAGVWCRMRGAHSAVELADIPPDARTHRDGQSGGLPQQSPQMNVPLPPNFQPSPHP